LLPFMITSAALPITSAALPQRTDKYWS
jgi:hypothetical protein